MALRTAELSKLRFAVGEKRISPPRGRNSFQLRGASPG